MIAKGDKKVNVCASCVQVESVQVDVLCNKLTITCTLCIKKSARRYDGCVGVGKLLCA